MARSFEITVGGTEGGQINPGEPLNEAFEYQDDQGNAINLNAGSVVSILEASKASLLTGIVPTITDAAGGVITLTSLSSVTASMRRGRCEWVRLFINPAGGDEDATAKIWFEVSG